MGSQRVGAGVIFDPFDKGLAGLALALEGGLGDAGGFRGFRQIVGGAPGLGRNAGFDDLLGPMPGAMGDEPVGGEKHQPEDGQCPGVTQETEHQAASLISCIFSVVIPRRRSPTSIGSPGASISGNQVMSHFHRCGIPRVGCTSA